MRAPLALAAVVLFAAPTPSADAERPICRSGYGQTDCARTSFGICTSGYGQVLCWDPPRFLIRGGHVDRGDARCVSGYGKLACGYHCVSGYGDVQCTRTPYGKCVSGYGKVLCWDPPRRAFRRGRIPPAPRCVSGYGKLACGYNCASGYGDVKCAPTPRGQCRAVSGGVSCWSRRHRGW